MIVRMWSGRVHPGSGTAYLVYLREHVFPEMRQLPGNISARVLRGMGGLENTYVVESEWTDLEAVKSFAGPDPLVAVVPAEARKLLASYDARVRHLNVVLESPRP